jgi:hypothetical protein
VDVWYVCQAWLWQPYSKAVLLELQSTSAAVERKTIAEALHEDMQYASLSLWISDMAYSTGEKYTSLCCTITSSFIFSWCSLCLSNDSNRHLLAVSRVYLRQHNGAIAPSSCATSARGCLAGTERNTSQFLTRVTALTTKRCHSEIANFSTDIAIANL